MIPIVQPLMLHASRRVAAPIGEIDDQADQVPAGEQDLGLVRQADEQIEAAEDRDRPDQPGAAACGTGARASGSRRRSTSMHSRHRDEGGQRAGIGQRGDLVERQEAGDDRDDAPR